MAEAPESNPKIDSLRAKVDADPKSRHFYPLAEELRKIGQPGEAEKVLRDGLQHHPTYLSAWISLGRVLKDRAAYPEAVDVLTRALTLDPENVVAAKLLANVYMAMGDKVEAIKKFKLVLALMPTDEETEEQIEALDRELNPQNYPPPPPPPPAAPADAPPAALLDETPHDSTEPPFPMDDPSASGSEEVVSDAPATSGMNFDLTNPDPFSLGTEPVGDAEETPPEPELADEAAPFADAELPDAASSGVTEPASEQDPFAEEAVPPDEDVASRRAPSSEDVWADEEEEAGQLPESAATVTMAQILAQQGDVERARETYQRVLERDPGNLEARQGLQALSAPEASGGQQGGQIDRLEAWRRKVVGS